MGRTFTQHLDPEVLPKRVLALDGGGIRGLISLGILERIEDQLGSPLSDRFDLIGGTSTGALIATKLALGASVDDIIGIYRSLGESVFKRSLFPIRLGAFRAKFDAKPLVDALDSELKGILLGSDDLKTGLAIVAKRLDSGSPWVLHNHPDGKYFKRRPGSSAFPNDRYPLTNLLRASTAAPHYFDPIELEVAVDELTGNAVNGLFVDGGVSPHNNPSLQLLMLATLEGHRFRWRTGADRLQVVSVGTGTWKPREQVDRTWRGRIVNKIAAAHAIDSLKSMMYDASALNELLLQWLSESPTARTIDSEVGDLQGELLAQVPDDDGHPQPLISYLRYDAPLELEWLNEHVDDMTFSEALVGELRGMDNPTHIETLLKVGRAAGHREVQDDHWV